ncbi:hypothetical protein R5R45_01785 [Oenococcus oeni]
MGNEVGFLKKIFNFFKKLFGSKSNINNENSNQNINITGSNNKVSKDTIVNNNTPKTELETRKEILTYKNNLYKHILSYKENIYDVDVIKLAELEQDQNFLDKIKELETNINIEIDLLKEHYPDLCVLAKKAFNSISDYHSVAVSYGILKEKVTIDKTDDKEIIKLYNQRSSEIDPYEYKIDDSFIEYMNANRK